jgi:transcriptional regulator with XRE-family HTH domain
MKFKLTSPERIGSRRRELAMTLKDLASISRVDYTRLIDMERAKYKRIDALFLEAVAYALRIHPSERSEDYEPPAISRLSYVGVDGRQIAAYLESEGISANELARRAGISHNYVYGVVSYDIQTIPADVARKLAKAMGYRGFEFAPALYMYPGPDGEMAYRDIASAYGGPTPDDVEPLPKAEDAPPPEVS